MLINTAFSYNFVLSSHINDNTSKHNLKKLTFHVNQCKMQIYYSNTRQNKIISFSSYV